MKRYIKHNENETLFVCLENNIISELDEYTKSIKDSLNIKVQLEKWCKYDFENLRCVERDNYIIVNFINECSYPEGFQNSYRTNLEKIVLNGKEHAINDSLEIKNN